MIIKVCGMRDEQNMNDVAALGADMLGMIFYPKSPRFVSMMPSSSGIIPDYSKQTYDRARNILAQKNSSTEKPGRRPAMVGVFVDEMPQNIITRVYNYGLDYVQLHGSEPRATIENLRATIVPDIRKNVKFIKAISVSSADDISRYKEYEGAADMFLFDTKCRTVGGSGCSFDWSVLEHYDGNTPFLLSGGIGPDDAERVLAFRHPMFAGIDLNSKFEDAPGMKNISKLSKFINKIRKQEK